METSSFNPIPIIFFVAILVLQVGANYITLEKGGIKGWKAFIPFYADACLYKLALGNGLFYLLNFIPVVGFVMYFIYTFKLAKAFGKSTPYAIAMILFPFLYYFIAYGKSEYVGEFAGNETDDDDDSDEKEEDEE